MISRLILIFCLFFFTFSILANDEKQDLSDEYKVRYIGIEKGLSNNAVTSIYQDKRGFMWVGTYDGLNRYDGYEFFVYRNQPDDSTTLINNRVVSVYEYGEGIWVATKKGLSVYNFNSGKFETRFLYDHARGEQVKISFNINQIKGDEDRLFMATAGKGLVVLDAQQNFFTQLPFELDGKMIYNYHAQGIAIDPKGNLLVFIQGYGLYSLSKDSGKLDFISRATNNANSIVSDKHGRVWIGMEGGLLMYSPETKAQRFFSREYTGHKVTGLMYLEQEDEIWAATDGSGVFIYKNQTGELSYLMEGSGDISITSNSVYALYRDNKGNKWVGTLRGGVNVVEKENLRFKTIRKTREANSLVNNFVLSFCEYVDNQLWIGTDGGGLSLWDRVSNKFTNYIHSDDPNSLPNNFVTSILKAEKGVWVGTYGGGVSKFDDKTKTFKDYPLFQPEINTYQRNIWVLFRDSYQRVWAATSDGEGLYRYHPDKDRFEFVDADINGILTMAEDLFGNIWVGTFERLIKVDLHTFEHEVFEIGYPVRSILSASNDRMLLGTEGGGLMEFNPAKGVVSSYLEEQGLPNNSVLAILRGKDDHYWLSTYNGISRFEYTTKNFTNYYDSDGLQSNQFNYNAALKLPGGELLFGGIQGFNILDPTSIRTSSSFPELLITGIKINNEPSENIGLTPFSLDALVLPYDKSMLTFDFAAIEYSLPDKISYAYYLEGWDREWQYVGDSRVANYSKLNDGEYTLHIKSTNSDGVWNPDAVSLPIVILPPWYRTPIAYLVYLLGLVLAVFVLVSHQRKQARLKYEIWFSKNMAQKEKELNEKKLNFFTNISHEFRSPLTMIINPLKDAIYGNSGGLGNGELEVVYRNSRRLLSLVDQLLLFRKTESEIGELKIVKIDLAAVVKEVYSCFVHHAGSRHINYLLHLELEECLVYADRQKIEISLFNLISNALKFANENQGEVVVRLYAAAENEVCVTVEDNGAGIAADERDKIFDLFYQSRNNHENQKNGFGIGLYLVKQFIRLHAGLVTASARQSGGTMFEIRLLKGRAHLQSLLIHEDFNEHSVFLEELLGGQELPSGNKADETPVSVHPTLLDQMKTILVVDDNQQIRNYLCSILGNDFKVIASESAENARQVLKTMVPELIISDVVMEAETGVEFCKFLKSSSSYHHIPVILLTGTNSEEIKLKGAEVGADDYITKPFDKDYLIARVKGILKQQKILHNHLMDGVTRKNSDFKLSEEDKDFLEQLEQLIEKHLNDDSFTIKSLTGHMGMSHSMLYKKIKQLTGKSINEMIRFIRLRKVAILLITSDMQVNEAAFFTGFNDLKYFRKQFQLLYQMNPSDFQKKYKGSFQEKDYNLIRFMDR